jgi:hypothetical protein
MGRNGWVMLSRVPLCLALALAPLACNKSAPAPTAEPAPQEALDPIDAAMSSLLTHLARGDYDGLKATTVEPLTTDLSAEAFSDLSEIVIWLGVLKSFQETKTDRSHGGGERWYDLQFERGGPVQLWVALERDGSLIGFRFSGDGFTEAEHASIAEEWREFKVYDFAYLDQGGERLEQGQSIVGNRVEYELVVGGIEAFVGKHHIQVVKTVLDTQGQEVFVEPIGYDATFSANAEGIPRGVVQGYLEVPGPGDYHMKLKITDRNSARTIDYEQPFSVVKGS